MPNNSGRTTNSQVITRTTLNGSSLESPINAREVCNTIPQNDTSQGQSLPVTSSLDLSDTSAAYTALTGLKSESPTILFVSEFIPLYDNPATSNGGERLTSQGDAIRLKQEAKLITAATAVGVLSQSLPVVSLINRNKEDLKSFFQNFGNSTNKTNITQFISSYYRLGQKLSPSSYRFTQPLPANFSILLSRLGRPTSEISSYCETKIWLQTLFELKKSLLTSTFSNQNNSVNSITDDTRNSIDTRATGRVVLNMSSLELPLLQDLPALINTGDVYSQYEQTYLDFEQSMYCRINNIEGISNSDFLGNNYSLTDDDLLTATTNVFRELRYCYSFAEDLNRQNLFDNFSYPKSERKNFKVWDALIGKIPARVQDKITPYTGSIDNKSLASLCQIYSSDNTRIDVFEKTPLLVTSESGHKHYWEGDLFKSITESSPSYELLTLQNRCQTAKKSIEAMMEIAGADPNNDYQIAQYIPEVFREKLFDILSKEGSSPGWMYLKSRSQIDEGIRFSSLVFKLCLRKDDVRLKKLKYRLYVWFSLLARQSSDRRSDYSVQIKFSLDKIVDLLLSYIDESVTDDIVEAASRPDQKRAIIDIQPTVVNNPDRIIRTIVSSLLDQSPTTSLIKSTLEWFIRELNDYLIDGKTSYSGISKEKITFAYFDLLMRIISSQTLETIKCFYRIQVSGRTRMGFLVDSVTQQQRDAYYENYQYEAGPTIDYMKKLKDAANKSRQDTQLKIQYLETLRKFVTELEIAAIDARLMLINDQRLKRFENTFNQVFTEEKIRDTSIGQRAGGYPTFLRAALSQNQLRNLDHVYSELRDRVEQSYNTSNKLRLSPTVNGLFPAQDFTDLTPLNPVSLLSHQLLSKYYSSQEFQTRSGNNKTILSVGIPHGLVEKIQSQSSLRNPVVSNYIRIKVWKIDRLYPDILFKPLEFLFDMNRYPTRSLSNWNFEDFSGNVSDLLKIPSKYYSPSYKDFTVHSGYFDELSEMSSFESKNSNEAIFMRTEIPASDRDNIMRQMYKNHSLSYLCEEYINWYTDEELSEDHYHNYTSINSKSNSKDTYQAVVNAIRSGIPASGQNSVLFEDYTTGQVLSFPTTTLQSNGSSTSIPRNDVQFTVNLTNTTVSYLRSPTLMSDPHFVKKRIVFPKKFDRVFNILLDPDDFILDSTTIDSSKINQLTQNGPFLRTSSNDLKRKDTTQNEIYLNEFFVTVEPYTNTSS